MGDGSRFQLQRLESTLSEMRTQWLTLLGFAPLLLGMEA